GGQRGGAEPLEAAIIVDGVPPGGALATDVRFVVREDGDPGAGWLGWIGGGQEGRAGDADEVHAALAGVQRVVAFSFAQVPQEDRASLEFGGLVREPAHGGRDVGGRLRAERGRLVRG